MLVGLRVHGFSLAAWHTLIDDSAASEVLLGEARFVRGDEWFVRLPLAFAQRAHDPPFARVNTDIGLGQDLILPHRVPIRHPLVLVRPTLWGFFLGDDLGMAWMWWSRLLGLFAVWLCVLWIVSEGRLGLSALGAVVLCLAPLFHFWALQAVPITLQAGLSFIGLDAVARGRSRGRIVAGGLLAAWAGTGLLLEFYPPQQVALGYLVAFLLAGQLLARRHRIDLRRHGRLRVAVAAAAGIACLCACLAFYLDARDAIDRMLGTAYPTGRASSGGDYPLWRLFNNALWIPLRVEDAQGYFGEAVHFSSFWFLSPVVALGVLGRMLRGRRRVDPLCAALALYIALMVLYGAIGLPESIARATLLSWMPGPRAALGLGIADLLLVIRHLSLPRDRSAEAGPGAAAALALLWCAVLAGCALFLHRELPELGLAASAALVGANGALAWAILRREHARLALAATAAGLAACSLWFNPVAVGGSDYLRENPLSRRILAIDRELGGRSLWVSYGSHRMGNLFRMLGVRALNGLHPLPQLELWRRLDPEERHRETYNRYAHVNFQPTASREVRFVQNGLDGFTVWAAPDGEALQALGVTHVLARSRDRGALDGFEGLAWLDSVGRNHVYRIREAE